MIHLKTIHWDDNCYYIDGKPVFLVSGEFHYFRVPKADWRRRLELFKEAGGNTVATYIPWLIHEPTEGDIRFGDVPERDLEGFLELCKELDIYVICRPGPYQYSELRYDGLPGWLCENYPEVHAHNVRGEDFRKSSISYLHPVFLEKVKKWYSAVCPIVAKYMLSKGGTVTFSQIDNEMTGIHLWFSGWDYNAVTMGIGVEGGRYPSFLKERYDSVEALNDSYDTTFTCFKEVRPYVGGAVNSDAERRRVKDYQDFYFGTIAEYGEILVNWMRQDGIDCPIVHNSPNPASNTHFLETAKRLGKDFILGSDHYYNLNQEWEQNSPTPQYASKVFYSNEMLRLMGYPATVYELPGGSCSDWPPITCEDLQCCYYTNVAMGMKGFNYYIFTGGPNPFNSGSFGDIYDYNASIGADGSIRPSYEVQKNFGNFLKERGWLAQAEREYDFHIGLDWEHSRSHSYFSNSGTYEFNNIQAWEFMRRGVMISAMCGSYSPNFADLYEGDMTKYIEKPLVVSTSVVMARKVQERLINFVRQGGQLMLTPVIPYLDENFNSCTLLQDFLGGASAKRCTEAAPRINVGTIDNILMNGMLFASDERPKNAQQIGLEAFSGQEICWRKRFENGGQVIWLGLQWIHAVNQHSAMLKYLLKEMGCIKPVVDCDNPNVWVSLRSNGDKKALFLMNLMSAKMSGTVKIKTGHGNYLNAGAFQLSPMEVKVIEIEYNKG